MNTKEDNIALTSDYGHSFPALIVKDNIVGAQFHPKKSKCWSQSPKEFLIMEDLILFPLLILKMDNVYAFIKVKWINQKCSIITCAS